MYLLATGMACPVGLTAQAACAAIRAGIAMFGELDYLDNNSQPIIGASVPGPTEGFLQRNRLIEMLSLALTDCISNSPVHRWDQVPLLVGMPEHERPSNRGQPADLLLHELTKQLSVRFHPQLSRAIPQGHTAGFAALLIARNCLRDPNVPACLVCGVDSYLNAPDISWLDQHWRLKTAGNSDGVIPGEAAAAVLITDRMPAEAQRKIQVTGLGFGREESHVLTEKPLLGLGLAQAARGALAEAGFKMHDVDFRLSDVTGESYGFREQALALARLFRVRREQLPIWHLADSIGDVGAAAGIAEIVVAYHAFLKKYAPGDRAACYTSAAHGERAVAIVQGESISKT